MCNSRCRESPASGIIMAEGSEASSTDVKVDQSEKVHPNHFLALFFFDSHYRETQKFLCVYNNTYSIGINYFNNHYR